MNIEDILLRARLQSPYFARAFAALRPTEARVGNPPTLAVDSSWRLYWSHEALSRWTLSEAAAVVLHEVNHLVRDHAGRRDIRDPALWNIAGDAEINDDVEGLPADGITPAKLGCACGLLAETYYESVEESALRAKAQCGSGSGGETLEGELEPDDVMTPAASAQVRKLVAADVRAHAQSSPGTVPAGLEIWANAQAEAVERYDWRRHLIGLVRRKLRVAANGRDNSTWSRLHRRTVPGSFLRPGHVAYTPRLAILTDTSGSMGEEADWVLGVEDAIRHAVGYVPARVDCDTEAYRAKGRTHRGGGGTDLRAGIREAESLCDVLVVLTDGETPWPSEEPACRTIAVFRKSIETPPWAEAVVVR